MKMLKYRCAVLLVMFTAALYGSQPEQTSIGKGSPGVAGYTERALSLAAHLTGRLAMRSFNFTLNYPYLTCTLATVAPLVFPRYRHMVSLQTRCIIHTVGRSFGQWLQHSLQEWLLRPFNDKLDITQKGLDDQHEILGGHTNQLAGLQDTIDKVYGDTQSLVKEHALLREKVSQIEGLILEHNNSISALGNKLDEQMVQGKAETLDKIDLLESHLGHISDDQKKLFEDYGVQFSGRFDQLEDHLRIVLEALAVRHAVSCGQQSRLAIAQ